MSLVFPIKRFTHITLIIHFILFILLNFNIMMTRSRTRLGEEEDTPLRRSVPLNQPRRESVETPENVRVTETLQQRIAELEAQVDNSQQSSHI